MKVHLMLTCLADAFAGPVGIATTELLERLGCEVLFSPRQTCCGQPLFNTGDWPRAKAMNAAYLRSIVGDEDPSIPIVCSSASCAAMMRHGSPAMGLPEAQTKVFELAEFLLDELHLQSWPGQGFAAERSITFHASCHTRILGSVGKQEQILDMIPGLTWHPPLEPEQCCGFGGAFSVELPDLSADIGREKLRNLAQTPKSEVVTGDLGCLLHLQGLSKRDNLDLRFTHFAELLREALD